MVDLGLSLGLRLTLSAICLWFLKSNGESGGHSRRAWLRSTSCGGIQGSPRQEMARNARLGPHEESMKW